MSENNHLPQDKALIELMDIDKEISIRNVEQVMRIWKRLNIDISLTDEKRWGLIFDELSDIRENLTGETPGVNDITFNDHGLGEKKTILIERSSS